MNEILNTLSMVDPLHAKITNLFADDSENTSIDIWNQLYDEVLLEARQRIV